MATNRIKVRVEGDNITVTSNDSHVKQVFFGWASWGTGSGKREYPEFYGRSIEKDRTVRPDAQEWQWDLTMDLVKHLYANILGLSERHAQYKFEAELHDDTFEGAAEMKANGDVLKVLGAVIRGENPHEELDAFTEAYIEAALWSTIDSTAEADGRDGENLDDNFGPLDISPESMKSIKEDCQRFQEENAALLTEAYEKYEPREGYEGPQLAGHDFWLTREGHGVGFWDRGLGELGEKLTKAAKSFGETYIEVGDDGQLHGF